IGLVGGALLSRGEQDRLIPLILVPDAETMEGDVAVQPLGIVLGAVQSQGLEAVASTGPAPTAAFAREFRYRDLTPGAPARLVIRTAARLGGETVQAVVDRADLVSSLDHSG